MTNRKKIIEEIMANFHAMKNKMHFKALGINPNERITHSQWFVLCLVQSHKNIGIGDISGMLHITASAASQLVDALIESGYVVQKTDSKDRRFSHINLSPKGKKIIAAMRKKHEVIMQKLFSSLSDQELETYLGLHKKILNNIQHEN